MSGSNVIVFGATGAVGGAAAQEAAEKGAKVWLAMRDPSKNISWLTQEKEDQGVFTRVQADLTDTSSVTSAIEKSRANSAFVYIVGSPKGEMRPAFQALKDAGVTWVVLLSSFTIIEGTAETIPAEDPIPYKHARAEIDLKAVGLPFAAVRPGFFASNLFLWYYPDIKKTGEVPVLYPEIEFDVIVPENIGQVAGALLVAPEPTLEPTEPKIVYVYGPKLYAQEEICRKVGAVIGKDVKIKSVSPEEYLEILTGKGWPAPFAKYILKQWALTRGGQYHRGTYPEGAENVMKYSGKQAITLDQYLESVKDRLQAD